MKLQNFAIIFLVIAIPLIVILSYYLSLQRKTLNLQEQYDAKLYEATKEGIEAFEINTVEWGTVNTNRENIIATINSFITSLSNKLNVSGTAKEYIQNYIPAIAFIDYDGYYIYSPSYVPETAENDNGIQLFYDNTTDNIATANSDRGPILYKALEGKGTTYRYKYTDNLGNDQVKTYSNLTTDISKAKMNYEHTLNNKITYSAEYKNTGNSTDVIVNYTLDNRIYVYGTVNGNEVNKNGYLVYFDNFCEFPQMYINGYKEGKKYKDTDLKVLTNLTETKYNGTKIDSETLEEQVLYSDGTSYKLETFKYVYDIENTKYYYDDKVDNFFSIREKDRIRQYLTNNGTVSVGSNDCKYKSISLLWGNTNGTEQYKKIYQVLNGKDKGKWFVRLSGMKEDADYYEEVDTQIFNNTIKELGLDNADYFAIYKDFSAINYYVEAKAFTNWVNNNLNDTFKRIDAVYNENTHKYEYKESLIKENPFIVTAENDPDKDISLFVEHKKEIMKSNIETNLNLAISNYNRNGTENYNFRMPVLTDLDWNQIFRNISLITFFQGKQIGLKYYNNYAIATSSNNNTFTNPDEIYFSGLGDKNFHRPYCEKNTSTTYMGYKNSEYLLRKYTIDSESNKVIHYYLHDNSNDNNSETACYYCVVNKSNFKSISETAPQYNIQKKAYREAIARERYYQKQNVKEKFKFNLKFEQNISGITVSNIPAQVEFSTGESLILSGLKPYTEPDTYNFIGWSLTPERGSKIYLPGDIIQNESNDITLYAIWEEK